MQKDKHISWDEYFMGIAQMSALRSKDPHTKVGACIISNHDKIILGTGYNGAPRRIDDKNIPWETRVDKHVNQTKYPYVVHAEQNAIINSWGRNTAKSHAYVTLFPCSTCTKLLLQIGIEELIYLHNPYEKEDDIKASTKLLKEAGIKIRQYTPEHINLLSNDNYPTYK
ncbi:hypothetical protein ASO20_02470 [Mycoplasma sp. (ex Biomphalaria glabrata)]|uniref:deoxycytidylate deaminase n=1 Tax=Mycoplasma sp. (ex Biomphalaria glabrata) TaxID=1749074 RepID=UPI00073A962D|nr:cytidine/deoxycytidylate deaminase family protein [Mycoplasma sp. (ex Biomphalaria glabrata)]ALV23499.1 hypothetical protein ASO20_02470 [Mycoplasma sp. (ex Biomphalaria glabrata)]